MAKTVIQHDQDPQIAIILVEVPHGPGSTGHSGSCTECGTLMYQRWEKDAIREAKRHVDSHEPVLIGGDRDSLIR